MSGCGTRIVLRGQKPLALCDRCPCFGSLFPPLAALTFAASSIICAFGLAAAAPCSPYRHLELCGIALEIRRNGQPGRLAPAVFWWDGQAEKSVCKAGEFNPQSVVGVIGWRAHNVRPYGKENTRNRENRASTGVIPFGWVGAPAEEKNTQSWKDRAHKAGGYIVRRLAPRRAGGENERIVNCAPKQHKAEKSVDRHRLFVIYLKNTK